MANFIWGRGDSQAGMEGGIRELWTITYPLVLATASGTLMQFINRMFVAWHSSYGLSAMVPAAFLSFTMSAFFYGIALYSNVFVAQNYGAKRKGRMVVSFWQGVWVALISFFAIIALIPMGHMIIGLAGHDGGVVVLERNYFTVVSFGYGLTPISASLSAFFTGRGKTGMTMLVNILGNLVNVLACYLLVFGVGFFPELGMLGAGYAFLIGNIFMIFAYLAMILSGRNAQKFRTRKLVLFHRKSFMNLIRLGAPNGVELIFDIAAFTVFVFLVGKLDKFSLAASNIIVTINMLAFMPLMGLGIAVTTLTGQYIGKGKHQVVSMVLRSALLISAAYVFVIGSIFLSAPEFWIGLFSEHRAEMPSSQLLERGVVLVRLLPLYLLSEALIVVYSGIIRGAGDTRFQMYAMLACAWLIFIPGEYLISIFLRLDIFFAWAWAAFYSLIFAFTLFLRFQAGAWKELRIVR
jgi:multidrug resistance protein, MATE family